MTTPTSSANGIDPRSPRFGAAITTVLLAATIVLTLIPATGVAGVVLLAVIVVLFAIGGIAGIRRHPYGALFRRFVRPRLAPPAELKAPEPPTFAQQVGLVITALALVLALALALALALVGVPYAAPVGAAIALVAASLNAVVDVCIGCLPYVWLVRRASSGSAPPADTHMFRM